MNLADSPSPSPEPGRIVRKTGVNTGFHIASHHQDRDDRILELAKINKYHVSLVPYFLKKLKETPDGDSNLLDNTLRMGKRTVDNLNELMEKHKVIGDVRGAGTATGALAPGIRIRRP